MNEIQAVSRSPLLLFYRDSGNFHENIMGQSGDLDAGAGGAVGTHEFSINFVEVTEIIHVAEIDGCLGKISYLKFSCLKDTLEVGKGLPALFPDVFPDHFAGFGMKGDLAGKKAEVSRADSGGIGANGSGGFVSVDKFHEMLLFQVAGDIEYERNTRFFHVPTIFCIDIYINGVSGRRGSIRGKRR